MSSNFYFQKWKTTLSQFMVLIQIDQEWQATRAHDQRRCQAAERLSGMLAAYTSVYNEVLECSRMNLQVQKTADIQAVLQGVVDRIHEIKQQLRKLEGCQAQFLSKGAIQQHLTVNDADFQDIPFRIERNEDAQAMIEEAFRSAKEKMIQRELELAKEEEVPEEESIDAWWEDDNDKNKDDDGSGDKFVRYDQVEELTEEALKIRETVALIQAHEKTRQIMLLNSQRIQKRELWEKELLGTLAPQARPELRTRAAKIIQMVARKYMELKRQKLRECKTNEVLGIRQCGKVSYSERTKVEQVKDHRAGMYKQLDKEWKNQRVQIKEDFYNRNHVELKEYYRDTIRDWFLDWYQKIGLFHNIPPINKGGSVAIWREEIPPPEEWYEKYKEYIAAKQKNKNQSSQEKKLQKKAALMERKKLLLQEKNKKRLEEQLKRKMMKNPKMHPGYQYPESMKFQKLIEVLEHYHDAWDDLDAEESMEVKEGNIKRLDEENLYAEVKLEVATEVDDEMKQELKRLNKALKTDYKNAGEKMPEPMPEKKKRTKNKKVKKAPKSETVPEKMEYLAVTGFLKEYPRTKLEDFIGNHNMVGDDCRCLDKDANPFAGEIRSLWWERCQEVGHGFHKILVVGPPGSGRTTLVHAMASINDAVLIELDPSTLDVDLVTEDYLKNVTDAVAVSAHVAQPAVIYFKNVHVLYYRKKKSIGLFPNAALIRKYFIKKLFKRINKTDNVTIVASCIDPWLTTGKLLKQFPEVLLLPDTSYSAAVQILNTWVINNRCLPRDLDVHSLARMLRGHSYAFLKATLHDFLSPDRIIKMAAYGLTAKEILDYVMETGVEKPDYDQYLKWYSKNTNWGKKEKKQLEEAREFRAAVEKYEEVAKKKKMKDASAAASKQAMLES